MKRFFRYLLNRGPFSWFLGDYLWYRRLIGGKWCQTHVDFPVCSCLWLKVPDDCDDSYREGLWRGTPTFEVYP